MKPVLAVIAAGGMGSAVGERLAENGVRVLTSLEGRSAASAARAKAAGMIAASDPEIATADIVLSIVPPEKPCRSRSGSRRRSAPPTRNRFTPIATP